MALYNKSNHATIKDTGVYFDINPANRTIIVPSGYDIIGTIGENLSEQITFRITSLVDGHEISNCERKYVIWKNADGELGTNALVVEKNEDGYTYLSWILRGNFTKSIGSVEFAVVFEDIYDTEEDSDNYRWATQTCKTCKIASTLVSSVGTYENIYVDGDTLVINDFTPIADGDNIGFITNDINTAITKALEKDY